MLQIHFLLMKSLGLKVKWTGSISMPSNIAEGSSRTSKSFRHFIDITLGSSFELQTQLLLAQHRKYVSDEVACSLENKIEEFQRMTMGFQNTLSAD
jgi:four helix bundle protein